MNPLQVFNNPELGEVRVIMVNGEPHFLAKDVSDILGYSQTQSMLKLLDDDEVLKIEASELDDANSMAREFAVINISGLYHAILCSKKTVAIKFRKWVTAEVLPQIQRTGSYSIAPHSLHNDILTSLQEVRQEKELTTEVINKLLHFLTYATDYRPNQESTNKAFSTIQNIIHIVATGFTARELKLYRVDSEKLHCGSQNFKYGKNGRLDKTEAKVGRNYLSKKELEREKQFVILILARLDLKHELNNFTFSTQEFIEFVWDCADEFCIDRDIPEISSTGLNSYIDSQVSRYNQNKQLCESGNKLYLEIQNQVSIRN